MLCNVQMYTCSSRIALIVDCRCHHTYLEVMTSSADIFSGTANPIPALPGTYGYEPSGYRLPDTAHVGEVHLAVSDLARSHEYYERTLGLHARPLDSSTVAMHAAGGASPLVVLHSQPGARHAAKRRHLGLFHFALLLPDRAALGRFVQHLADIGERAGAGDHLVSEAFYLHDPDGLGIEVYADRPRSTWMRQGRELMMATDPVDIAAVVRAANGRPWEGMPSGTVMGHVHLHVGEIERASEFYSGAIGFDRMVTKYPGALFLAAGGYHHHLGTNTWAGPTATAATVDDARLLEWTLVVPADGDINAVFRNSEARGFDVLRDADGSLLTRDPWGTQLRILTAKEARP